MTISNKIDDLISVIVPIYKVEKWLEKCINSILVQTYENLEIILVDDGSPDQCPNMCDIFAKKDSRIKVIHKLNGGLSSARNAGLDIATGTHIVFVDSDDYIHPDMIRGMHKAIEKECADMIICAFQYVDEENHAILEYPINIIKDGIFCKDDILRKMCDPFGSYYVVVWNKMYCRKIWEHYRFPEGKIHEDEFAIHHILDQCQRIVCTSSIYYYYVQRSGSIMSREKTVGCSLDKLEAFLERQAYFIEHRMTDYIFIQDIWCFDMLRNIYSMHLNSEEINQYELSKRNYYLLHDWIVKHLHYPTLRRIKIALYKQFPKIIIWIENYHRRWKYIDSKTKN